MREGTSSMISPSSVFHTGLCLRDVFFFMKAGGKSSEFGLAVPQAPILISRSYLNIGIFDK